MKEVSSADLLCKRRHCIWRQHEEVRVLPKDEVELGMWWSLEAIQASRGREVCAKNGLDSSG